MEPREGALVAHAWRDHRRGHHRAASSPASSARSAARASSACGSCRPSGRSSRLRSSRSSAWCCTSTCARVTKGSPRISWGPSWTPHKPDARSFVERRSPSGGASCVAGAGVRGPHMGTSWDGHDRDRLRPGRRARALPRAGSPRTRRQALRLGRRARRVPDGGQRDRGDDRPHARGRVEHARRVPAQRGDRRADRRCARGPAPTSWAAIPARSCSARTRPRCCCTCRARSDAPGGPATRSSSPDSTTTRTCGRGCSRRATPAPRSAGSTCARTT